MARILVAEDEPAVAQFIQRALRGAGHEVTLAADGAIAYMEAQRGRFDLLLADIQMPVMDGIALALAIGAEQPALPILLMTGYAAEYERAADFADFVAGLLLKPFSLADLLAAIDKALLH
ncbi:response regulator [Zavarzinia sp.]|uniref:response regulator n=1 Tax=Zavarzinia sp. TaxID=2027920 RepID=UPI003566D1D3